MITMLTARQLLILEFIIQYFTLEGEAVGSKTIVDQTDINASSATVRNEMSVLEKEGYIQKTHLSSGRIPSLKGYRFYLDYLMTPEKISDEHLRRINQALDQQVSQLNELVKQSARILSELTNYTAIVLEPNRAGSQLSEFRMIPVSNHQVMLILQTTHQSMESMIFHLSDEMDLVHLQQLNQLFNEQLVGLDLPSVIRKLQTDIPLLVKQHIAPAQHILRQVEHSLHTIQQNQIYVSGKTNLLDFMEELNREQVKDLFNLLDNQEAKLSHYLHPLSQDIEVKMGAELDSDMFNNLSLITATYHVGQFGQGRIALLGPTNMAYSKTFGLMNAVRNELSQAVLNYYFQ
ncbi:hypothetical protein B8A33_05270 [Dolosigranulum pigrum]|jgi:heat-inducible transcription repressor hrcA|nr:hypothetical protein B8A33_05270 [Dolosigranulum pigrum]